MQLYPFKLTPLYLEKLWGGRNLQRLFGRDLQPEKNIGESWELADLKEGASVLANGPLAGKSLTELTRQLGPKLLGDARPESSGRFPLLLKLLDANDILSLQVHPDEQAVRQIGPEAALKTECWYVLESRGGYVYKGLKPGVTRQQFAQAIQADKVQDLVRRLDVHAGDFYYLPAGTVHALGAGVVVAEVQTPSDTTYRVTDWGRGREIHVERSLQCIHFETGTDECPGADGDVLLRTPYFTVARRTAAPNQEAVLAAGRCTAIMFLAGAGTIDHTGPGPGVQFRAGDTILLPADLQRASCRANVPVSYLEATLPT